MCEVSTFPQLVRLSGCLWGRALVATRPASARTGFSGVQRDERHIMTLDTVRSEFERQFGIGGEFAGRGGVEEAGAGHTRHEVPAAVLDCPPTAHAARRIRRLPDHVRFLC
jgi:hypothetical protein